MAAAAALHLQAASEPVVSDVFISGKDGYHTYRIPAIEAAADGSLIAFAEARRYSADDPGWTNQEIDLVYKRSADDGASWSPMKVLEHAGELWCAANPATLLDRGNGRLWVFYIRARPGRSTDTARPGTDDMQTLARRSDDNGRSWSEPVDLTGTARDMTDTTWRASVPGPGGAIQTRTGRLLVPMWKMPFGNFVIYSDDHGSTWRRGRYVPGNQGGDECQVAELTDGRILMDIRQETGAHRWLAESQDGGTTWGEPRPGVAVAPVACALERFALRTPGGERNCLLWTGPTGTERKRLRLLISDDEGKTFARERLISDQYAAYSDLTILKDGTVGVLWERGADAGYQFITFTRLSQAWLGEDSSRAQLSAPQVISRGEAAGTYQAFPDLCRLKNGDLLCVFYAGYGHVSLPRADCPKGGRICCVRSSDEGRTWSAPRILFDGPFDDRDPHIAQMRDGSVVCSFFTYRPQPGGQEHCDTCLVTSRDGGATWKTEPRIVAPGWPSSAPVRELPDGTRILGVYREEGATAYGGVIRSTDGGKTWSAPIPIGQGSGVRLDAETDVVLLKDGTLYAALRGDRVNMHFATSPDGGLTWSPVKDIGFRGHCPHFTRLSTGEILLVHRLPLTALHISRDEARTWQGPYQIDETPGAYPSTVELKDRTILVVYYEEGEHSAIRARRFRLTGNGIEFVGGSMVTASGTSLAGLPAAPAPAVRVNYARPFEPPTRPAFLPLPPGAVEPAGWLRDWCLAARDGYTGHMDEYDDEFKRAWAPDQKMTGEGLLWYKGAWPYEGGGYWFDGLARLGFALHDEALIQQAQRRLYAVADHMNTNALLFLWWLNRNNPEDRKAVIAALEGWPLWACGLLGRAMAGFYAGAGDQHILEALEAAYGSDPDCLRSIPGNVSSLWPAFDTYCWTGNRGIAEALNAMFKKGGQLSPRLNRYRQPPDLKPGATVENAHVVEFIESTTPWLLGYLWTGDRRYLEAAVGWHDLLERIAMQPYGVPVADEWYGPTGAFRGSETCDVAGYVWSQVCLLEVTGEGRMADRLERAFFNAGPATVSRDFKSHVYFQSPNRFANLSPDFPHGPRASGGAYRPKHSPLCCTAALNRIVPWFVTHLWMATYDNGLAAVSYGPCRVTALAGDHVPVVIACRTDYPFDDTVEVSVQPARETAFPLCFHIPGWCTAPALSLNGEAVVVERDARDFARISRSWKSGDIVRLRLPMTPGIHRGRDAASGPPYDGVHRPTRVTIPGETSTRGVPYASVSYGPLLFAVPIPDTTDANTPDPAARWRFALDVQNPGLAVERAAMPARWDWPLNAPLKLRANAVEVPWNPDPRAPSLPLLPASRSKPAEPITLIPYGCTKFRISMFPVTAEPEAKPSAIRRILFLGNSITLHGPKEDIGWTGNWGMAASSEDEDYVHLVTSALARQAGATPRIVVRNIADFERNYATYDVDAQLKDCFEFDPDLVVLAIGENVPALGSGDAGAKFKAGVLGILRCALARRHPLVVVRSCFWADAGKDRVLREACEEAGGIFVDAGPLGRDAANAARAERSFAHAGVAAHPGDRGMKALADAIVGAVLRRDPASR